MKEKQHNHKKEKRWHKERAEDRTSKLFNRYVWLVDLIYRLGNVSFEEIKERWRCSSLNEEEKELPLRTFHNHRDAIQDMFDINIECDKRNGYKYYIENTEDMERGGVRSWLLNTFAVNNLINESHKLKQRIVFEEIPSGRKYLTPIIEAMRDNLSVEITYQSYWQDKPHTFEIEPYCVKVFKQCWYVIANNPYYENIRIYSLDRISALRTTDTIFDYPKSFNPQDFFIDNFGIIADENCKIEKVSIKVNNDKRKYMRALPLHHSQNEAEINNEYSVFQYMLRPTYDFIQEVLSHGSDVEVLEPESLRKNISDIVKYLHGIYSK